MRGLDRGGVAWVGVVMVIGVVDGDGVTLGVADAGGIVVVGVMVVGVVVGEIAVVKVVEVEVIRGVAVGVVGVLVVVVGLVASVVVEIIGEVVVGAVIFTRLRPRPYRIHMGSCLALAHGISGGRVGVVVEGVESVVVWGVVVVGVGVALGLFVVVVVGRLAPSPWCNSQWSRAHCCRCLFVRGFDLGDFLLRLGESFFSACGRKKASRALRFLSLVPGESGAFSLGRMTNFARTVTPSGAFAAEADERALNSLRCGSWSRQTFHLI